MIVKRLGQLKKTQQNKMAMLRSLRFISRKENTIVSKSGHVSHPKLSHKSSRKTRWKHHCFLSVREIWTQLFLQNWEPLLCVKKYLKTKRPKCKICWGFKQTTGQIFSLLSINNADRLVPTALKLLESIVTNQHYKTVHFISCPEISVMQRISYFRGTVLANSRPVGINPTRRGT